MNKNESKYYNTALLMDEALLALLETKEYEYISIKEICRKAGVNRSTFYLHYENVDDLLRETIEMLNRRFCEKFEKNSLYLAKIEKADKAESVLITPEYLKPYLEFVKENLSAFRIVCEKKTLFQTEKTFNRMYGEIFLPILNKFDVPDEEKPYIFAYFSQGVVAMVRKWTADGCKMPIDELIELITGCVGIKTKDITR